MSSKPNTEKRVPKTPVKLGVQLSEDQKLAKELAYLPENKIIVLTGKAGCGKSLLAANTAIDMLISKRLFNRISITRAAVDAIETRPLGALPGELHSKMLGYTYPIIDNFIKVLTNGTPGKPKVDTMIAEGVINTIPINFMRGHTVDDEIMIIEEAQNITVEQLKLVLTRIGKKGKMIFTGDIAQCDISQKSSGLTKLIELCNKIKGMVHVELTTNHRDPLVEEILKHFNN